MFAQKEEPQPYGIISGIDNLREKHLNKQNLDEIKMESNLNKKAEDILKNID